MTDNIKEVRKVMAKPETIDAGIGHNKPPAPPDDTPPPDGPADPVIARLLECCELPLNDFGNGQRFVAHFGEDSLYVPRVGWHCYDGKVWNVDPDEMEIRRRAQKIAPEILKEIDLLDLFTWEKDIVAQEPDLHSAVNRIMDIKASERSADDKRKMFELNDKLDYIDSLKKRLVAMRKTHRAHARAAGNSGPIKNLLLESTVAVARELDEMDANPLCINTLSGALSFSTEIDQEAAQWTDLKSKDPAPKQAKMELLPHDRGLLLTKIMPVEFDIDANCELFDTFMERIHPALEMRKFIQRWCGLSMTGLTGEQKLVFFFGSGSNGKSVLVDLIARMMGAYAATAKIESLTGTNKRGGGDATPDLIPLMGARMVRASEPEEGERLREGMIKELTGGEPMLVRALHSDFVEVKPQFKLTISGNHKPEIRGTDDGIWRRVLLIPFDVQIPKEDRDPLMGENLWNERSGILNWLIEGLRDYLENGLQEPESIIAATQAFRSESDPVHAFLMDCCEVSGSEKIFTRSKDIAEAFNYWLDECGKTRWSMTQISRRIADKADKWRDPRSNEMFASAKVSVKGYRGIRLTDMFKRRMDEAAATRPYSGRSSLPDIVQD